KRLNNTSKIKNRAEIPDDTMICAFHFLGSSLNFISYPIITIISDPKVIQISAARVMSNTAITNHNRIILVFHFCGSSRKFIYYSSFLVVFFLSKKRSVLETPPVQLGRSAHWKQSSGAEAAHSLKTGR